jgi:glyoxylase-like metal-dependent hydrolase (beta-lactamase superfamily II)
VRRQLEAGLAEHGVTIEDIERVLLTHYHPDHTGLAGELQQASGASVHVHEADAELVEGHRDAWDRFDDRQRTVYEEWAVPPPKRDALLEHMAEARALYGVPVEVTPFTDGDRFDLGETELEVVHTPGHSAGHCCLAVHASGTVLTGDAVLPHYTPNVGGADIRLTGALERYRQSLERFASMAFDRALPGHREPIHNPSTRAEYILAHHEERARRVLGLLSEDEWMDTWTVSAHLFGELEGIHVLHGPGEAHAHLEHLTKMGATEASDGGYRLTPETAERLETEATERWPLTERP